MTTEPQNPNFSQGAGLSANKLQKGKNEIRGEKLPVKEAGLSPERLGQGPDSGTTKACK